MTLSLGGHQGSAPQPTHTTISLGLVSSQTTPTPSVSGVPYLSPVSHPVSCLCLSWCLSGLLSVSLPTPAPSFQCSGWLSLPFSASLSALGSVSTTGPKVKVLPLPEASWQGLSWLEVASLVPVLTPGPQRGCLPCCLSPPLFMSALCLTLRASLLLLGSHVSFCLTLGLFFFLLVRFHLSRPLLSLSLSICLSAFISGF